MSDEQQEGPAMTNIEHNETDRRNGQAYTREFLPAVVGYGAAVAISTVVINQGSGGWWRYLVFILPVIPALWGARAIARHLARVDEYQRSVQLSAMAVGFGVAMIAAMTIGFLSIGGVTTERWGPWVIYSAGMLGWVLAAGRHFATRD